MYFFPWYPYELERMVHTDKYIPPNKGFICPYIIFLVAALDERKQDYCGSFARLPHHTAQAGTVQLRNLSPRHHKDRTTQSAQPQHILTHFPPLLQSRISSNNPHNTERLISYRPSYQPWLTWKHSLHNVSWSGRVSKGKENNKSGRGKWLKGKKGSRKHGKPVSRGNHCDKL